MKVKSLAKAIIGPDNGVHLSFFRPTLSLLYAAKDLEHSKVIAEQFCRDTAIREGTPWIKYWSAPGDEINCPEGAIELPSDLWVCKLSGEMCPIQASISLNNSEEFFELCTAPNEKKKAIYRTVESGKYSGFHHVSGRYLCPSCENKGGKKTSFFYHYPWEFAELDLAIGETYEDTRKILVKRGDPTYYVSSPLCAPCCYDLALSIRPELTQQLMLFELDVNFREKSA